MKEYNIPELEKTAAEGSAQTAIVIWQSVIVIPTWTTAACIGMHTLSCTVLVLQVGWCTRIHAPMNVNDYNG